MRTLLIAALMACTIPTHASAAADPRDCVGYYQLADGRTLWVSRAGRRMYATIDGYPSRQILPAGGSTFISRQGDLRLDFVEHANGGVFEVTLRIAARPPER